MNFSSRSRRELSVDVTPLIDIIFQLLLFFMVTTTFVTPSEVESAIEVELPDSSASGMLTEQGELEVEITADDQLLLDGRLVDTDALRLAFEAAAAENPSALVVIHADEGVDHGTVVTVMDTANQAGLGRLGIATEPLEEGTE